MALKFWLLSAVTRSKNARNAQAIVTTTTNTTVPSAVSVVRSKLRRKLRRMSSRSFILVRSRRGRRG